MCFKLMNLIVDNKSLNNTQKTFLFYMLKYANSDGTGIRVSNATLAEKFDLSVRTIINMRNETLAGNYMICTQADTPRSPAHYRINIELLEAILEQQQCVDNLSENHLGGEKSASLGVKNLHPRGEKSAPNLPITYPLPCINTVGISKSVDNSPRDYPPKKPIYRKPNTLRRPYRHEVRENISKIVDNFVERGVAQEHTIPIVEKPCDTIDLPSEPNDLILDALKTVLAGKEGEPSFIAATRYLDSLQPSRMAA